MSMLRKIVMLGLLALPLSALAGGLAPWTFGMSKAQVAGFAAFGPYRSFANGDLETYAGVFDGRKQNVQFFFGENRLRRIGVYVYEGKDVKAAAIAWRQAYESLGRMYGEIETPGLITASGATSMDPEVLSIAAGVNVEAVGKTQMAPKKQPSDMFVFSSFSRQDIQGARFYYVIVYFDPPRVSP